MIGPDPGTYYSAQLPPQERRKAGRCATNALKITEGCDVDNVESVRRKASDILRPNERRGTMRRRRVAICKACEVIEDKIVKMAGHGSGARTGQSTWNVRKKSTFNHKIYEMTTSSG